MLGEVPVNCFLSGRRGARNFSDAFRIVFLIFLLCIFQTLCRIDLKFLVRGQLHSADVLP